MIKRFKIKFFGIVQGVGFRPFIYKLAKKYNLTGYVKNLSDSVLVEIQGNIDNIDRFISFAKKSPPKLAKIIDIEVKEKSVKKNSKNFEIKKSNKNSNILVHISPDIAICKDCREELLNPSNKRFKYPFINCTNCGPRFTIINDIPYDRKNSSMAKFIMCNSCKSEYNNPLNRRYHAEPICCSRCGPTLEIYNGNKKKLKTDDVIKTTIKLLKSGYIIAIKGLGGFHLAVDATNNTSVKELRKRKNRYEKPFAIMAKDMKTVRKVAYLSKSCEKYLKYPISPIFLLKKRENNILASQISPNINKIGIMLPYTPLHILLFEENIEYLVMTSGNFNNEPICIDNNEAFEKLKNIADFFLINNRDILVRCDDSVVSSIGVIRRSRGYSPSPIIVNKKYKRTILALGAHLKNSICILKNNTAFLSPHIGDLDTPEARDFFYENINVMARITETKPDIIVTDLHPYYFTTLVGEKLSEQYKIPLIKVQHHHAHIVSCMVENNIKEPVIGISFDGTGYGIDGKVWGGEIFVADIKNFRRIFHLKNFLLLGGGKAVTEINRIAISLLQETFKESWKEIAKNLNLAEKDLLNQFEFISKKRLNSIETSSMGRLFDGVAALLNIRNKNNFEGQAPMELESICKKNSSIKLSFEIRGKEIDFRNMIKNIVNLKLQDKPASKIAYAFHLAVVEMIKNAALKIRESEKINKVVLSGGCFQNEILFKNSVKFLKKENFHVITHKNIPCNDGGIALGQAIVGGNNYD